MRRNTVDTTPIVSTFLSCEKDTETILRKLFIESRPHSDVLKRLLVVQAPDALDKNYDMSEYGLKKLLDEQYIVLSPKVRFNEHAQVKSFITLSFDDFAPSGNPQFRNSVIYIDVACNHDYWDLGDYRQRPFKIMGYIDGILNKSRLSGIGQLEFIYAKQTALEVPDWGVYTLAYAAVHGDDDKEIVNEE